MLVLLNHSKNKKIVSIREKQVFKRIAISLSNLALLYLIYSTDVYGVLSRVAYLVSRSKVKRKKYQLKIGSISACDLSWARTVSVNGTGRILAGLYIGIGQGPSGISYPPPTDFSCCEVRPIRWQSVPRTRIYNLYTVSAGWHSRYILVCGWYKPCTVPATAKVSIAPRLSSLLSSLCWRPCWHSKTNTIHQCFRLICFSGRSERKMNRDKVDTFLRCL